MSEFVDRSIDDGGAGCFGNSVTGAQYLRCPCILTLQSHRSRERNERVDEGKPVVKLANGDEALADQRHYLVRVAARTARVARRNSGIKRNHPPLP